MLKEVHGLCLFGCACDKCLVLGAGGRPPDDGGGSTEDHTTLDGDPDLQSPDDSASTASPVQNPTDMSLPLGPGQWPDQLGAPASHASV